MTTPESADLQKILSDMVDEEVTHVVMEASSHAIDLHRIGNIRIRIGVFTNLSQDHLDYHKDMASYWACKKRFFTECLDNSRRTEPAFAVINCLNKEGEELQHILDAKEVKPNIITIGIPDRHQVGAVDVNFNLDGINGLIKTPAGNFEFRSSLVGRFNLDNILCATGAGLAIGLPLSGIAKGIESFTSVPGRLEPVVNHSGRFVFVDYAHTPDALENVLSTLRSLTKGRVICIFGCGGDRDRIKRPLMGRIAGRYSDIAIITSDNPRTENPMAIIDEIASGIKSVAEPADSQSGENGRGYLIEPNRKKAIEDGISMSSSGDTVLIAGKGHETYQIIGVEKFPFDDRVVAKEALKG
jgi:UDP-N-acetylmuramyl-tripeptide synthetase